MNETPEGATPQETPPQPAPQASIPVADLSGALVDAFHKITASNAPRPQAQNPLDNISQADREALEARFLTDPIGAARYLQDMTAQQTRNQMLQEALPLIQTSANTIVELYKSKKQRSDPYFVKVEPGFDRLMVGVDITPLVRMNEATRNSELDMRWKMARADVLEIEMKRTKPDPLPMGGNGGSAPTQTRVSEDPWFANMAREYGFTKEQLEELEQLNG